MTITAHQEILYNVTGQSLIWDAPEGRPASVTSVTVYLADADDDTTPEFTATGTVETNPNTTTVGTSGNTQPDPTQIVLTSATGVASGRQYTIQSAANGDFETFMVERLATSTVTARHPLINDYAAGSTVTSSRITAPVNSTWVATKNKISCEGTPFPTYRVVWVYVVGSTSYRHESYIDLVRTVAQHTVTALDVDEIRAGWLDELPTDYRREQGRPLIERAFRYVKLDLLANGKLARWVRHLDVINDLVAHRTVMVAAEARVSNFGTGYNAQFQAARDAYDQRFGQLIREPKVPIQVSPGGAATEGDRLPLWRR